MTKNLITLLSFCLIVTAAQWGCSEAPVSDELFFIGTFDLRDSEGLYVFTFDRANEKLTLIQTISDRKSPNFQAVHPDGKFLFSVSRNPFSDDNPFETVSSYRIDRQTGSLTLISEQPVEGRGACHVSVDPAGKFVYVSNYTTGNLSVFRMNSDGSLTGAVDVVQHTGSSVHPNRQQRPHMHSSIPSADGHFLYASDLGIDKIAIYQVNRETGKLTPAATPYAENHPGSGPRHFTIHPGGQFAYSAEELSSTVAVFRVQRSTGALDPIQRVNMLPEGFDGTNTAADIHISPDGKFLYATNRGHDSLVIYSIDETSGKLKLVGHEPTRGGHPRNFGIDKKGDFLFVANRDDDHVVFFRRDKETGLLSYTGLEVTVPGAVCVTQLIR